MMRSLILAPVLVLLALVGGLFPLETAYAGCCMCGTCRSFCTCPGVGSCAKCHAPDLIANKVAPGETLAMPPLSIQVDQLLRSGEAGQCASAQRLPRLKVIDADNQNIFSAFPNSDLIQGSLIVVK